MLRRPYPVILAFLCFVAPIAGLLMLVIGISYLFAGIFRKEESVKPALESIFYAEPGKLHAYISRLKIFTIVNLSCPVVMLIALMIERPRGLEYSGWAVVLNVILLITFIITLWRMRSCLTKAAVLMGRSGEKYLLNTLFSRTAIIRVYILAFVLIKDAGALPKSIGVKDENIQ